jgi:hypothetical protein
VSDYEQERKEPDVREEVSQTEQAGSAQPPVYMEEETQAPTTQEGSEEEKETEGENEMDKGNTQEPKDALFTLKGQLWEKQKELDGMQPGDARFEYTKSIVAALQADIKQLEKLSQELDKTVQDYTAASCGLQPQVESLEEYKDEKHTELEDELEQDVRDEIREKRYCYDLLTEGDPEPDCKEEIDCGEIEAILDKVQELEAKSDISLDGSNDTALQYREVQHQNALKGYEAKLDAYKKAAAYLADQGKLLKEGEGRRASLDKALQGEDYKMAYFYLLELEGLLCKIADLKKATDLRDELLDAWHDVKGAKEKLREAVAEEAQAKVDLEALKKKLEKRRADRESYLTNEITYL